MNKTDQDIIGEAIKRVSKDLHLSYPEIPWEDIAGMRDKLINDYFGVDINMKLHVFFSLGTALQTGRLRCSNSEG